MSDRANVNNGGVWRGDRRIIADFEYFVGAGFCWLWGLHRILRLKGFVIIVVWDDVCREYVCLPGFMLVDQNAEGSEGPRTRCHSCQAHVGVCV